MSIYKEIPLTLTSIIHNRNNDVILYKGCETIYTSCDRYLAYVMYGTQKSGYDYDGYRIINDQI